MGKKTDNILLEISDDLELLTRHTADIAERLQTIQADFEAIIAQLRTNAPQTAPEPCSSA